MKPVNYLDQLLYTGIQTRHIMALTGHRRYSQDRPKREMFEALMPVASSSSPTHDIYGLLMISVVVSFQRRNNSEHTQCSLWF